MGAREFVGRIPVVTVAMIVLGVVMLFGFQLLEPMTSTVSSAPSSLGWGDMGLKALGFMTMAFAGILLVLTLWFITAPIQADQRQQFR